MERIQSADASRVVAIAAVIGIHTALYSGTNSASRMLDAAMIMNVVERFAVPMFFVLSGFFWSSQCAGRADYLTRSIKLSKRVFQIFVIWSLVYLLAPVGDAYQKFGILGNAKVFYWSLGYDGGLLRSIFEGTKVHLWFLPGLICSALISGFILRYRGNGVLMTMAFALYLVGLGGSAYANSPFGFHSDFTFRDGPFFGLVFFATGHVLAQIKQRDDWFRIGLALTIGGFILQLLETCLIYKILGGKLSNDFVLSTYPYGVGTALMALSNAKALQNAQLVSVGPLVLGIYASHFLFVDLLRPVDHSYHGMIAWDIGYVAIVLVLSLMTTYFLSKIALTRRFVM